MKFIQIATTHTQPYVHPCGEFHWGFTEVFALGEDGVVYVIQPGYEPVWTPLTTEIKAPPSPKESL